MSNNSYNISDYWEKLKLYNCNNILKKKNSFRKKLIHNLFLYSCKLLNDNKACYNIVGSNNLTSDCDVSILSENAPDIINTMIYLYYSKTNKLLPIELDINFYCHGLWSYNNFNKNINGIIKYKNNYTSFCLDNNSHVCILDPGLIKNKKSLFFCEKLNISYAFIPLYKKYSKHINKTFDFLKVELLHKRLEYELQSVNSDLHLLKTYKGGNICNKNISNKEYKELVKDKNFLENKYNLVYKYSKLLWKLLYNNNNKNIDYVNLYNYVNKLGFYLVEASITCCTYNVVVYELQQFQKNPPRKISKINYLCCALECLGNYSTNMHNINYLKNTKKFIKQSKYLYRLFYSLYKLDLINENDLNIIENIYKFRKLLDFSDYKKNIKEINANINIFRNYFYKSANQNFNTDNFVIHILNLLEPLINKYKSYNNKKSKKIKLKKNKTQKK